MIEAIEHVAENVVLVTVTSILTDQSNQMELPLRQGHLDAWAGGMLIQDAMPHLSAEQREFLMTGITPDEWDAEFA